MELLAQAVNGTKSAIPIPGTSAHFLDPTVPAWFEVTLDRRTLRTLDSQMTAAAHFMHDRYVRFDEPLRIVPP